MYKIAIVGASTLLGKELKDAISESTLAAATFTLLDDEAGQGQLDQVGDEITFVRAIEPDAFDKVDFTFFCGSSFGAAESSSSSGRTKSSLLSATVMLGVMALSWMAFPFGV